MDNDQHPTSPRADDRTGDTAEIPWARTTTMPATVPAAVPATAPTVGATTPPGPAAPQAPPLGSAPAVDPPVWSGKKTAIAAALAIGFASVGAIGAAAALPAGSAHTDQGGRGFPAGGQLQPGGQLPQGQLPQGQAGQANQQSQGGTQQFGAPGQQGFPGGQGPGVPQDDDGDNGGVDDGASTT